MDLLGKVRQQAEQGEVFRLAQKETGAHFEANRLKLLETRETQGLALRLVKDGRIGFASTTRPGGEDALASMALEVAPWGTKASFLFPESQAFPTVAVYDDTVESLSPEALVALGQAMLDQVLRAAPELQCEAWVDQNVTEVEILNTRGGHGRYRKTTFSLGIEGMLTRGTDMLFVGDSLASGQAIADPSAVARATLEQLERAREIASPPASPCPVIFTPRGVASAFVWPLLVGFNGKTVLQGASPLGQRLGERVFDRRINLWDRPTLPLRPGSRPWDDEGVPSQDLSLVEGGAVTHFLYDLQTAGLAGVQSTSSAHRALGSLPQPGASTLVFGDGDASLEDMVADVREGLIVERLIGAGQGNVLGGEFGGNVLLGYKIERGKLVGRVKDTMIHGNIYEALADLAGIGSEAQWVGGALRAPAIYCAKVAIAAVR